MRKKKIFQRIGVCLTGFLLGAAALGGAGEAKAAESVTYTQNTALKNNGIPQKYAAVYEYENLTLAEGVHLTSYGISQLVLKVNGTLTINQGADIRVRNGYYPEAPEIPISSYNSTNLQTLGEDMGEYRLYPNSYGQGGDGADGGRGSKTSRDGYAGNGGGGGYGGGKGGKGGVSGESKKDGDDGSDNGGDGGVNSNASTPVGGGAVGVGMDGEDGTNVGNSGAGGGGNGGYGGRGAWGKDYGYGIRIGGGGSGGGGGGYGGGILTIIAEKIVINSDKPCFLVSGQAGGAGGNRSFGGEGGHPGDGEMLIINSNSYQYQESQWTAADKTDYSFGVERPSYEGGHGMLIGKPLKVFINGAEYGKEQIPASGIKKRVTGITMPQTLNITQGVLSDIAVTVLPADASDKSYTLSSENSSVVSVIGNQIIGLKEGAAKVTATSRDGGKTASCTVVVKGTTSGKPADNKPSTGNNNTNTNNTNHNSTNNTSSKKPSAPKWSSCRSKAYNQIQLKWKKVSGASRYLVYRSTNKKTYKLIGKTSKLSFVDKKVSTGKRYYYKIRAVNSKSVKGSYSTVKSAKPVLSKTVLKVKKASRTSVVLSWNKISGANRYIVYRKTGSTGKYKKVKTVRGNKVTLKKLSRNKTYSFKVRAYRKSGKKTYYSSYSTAKKVKL